MESQKSVQEELEEQMKKLEEQTKKMNELGKQNQLLLEQIILLNKRDNQEEGRSWIEEPIEEKNEEIVVSLIIDGSSSFEKKEEIVEVAAKEKVVHKYILEVPLLEAKPMDGKSKTVIRVRNPNEQDKKTSSRGKFLTRLKVHLVQKNYTHVCAYQVFDKMPSRKIVGCGLLEKTDKSAKSLDLQQFDMGLVFSSLYVNELDSLNVCEFAEFVESVNLNCVLKVYDEKTKQRSRLSRYLNYYVFDPGIKGNFVTIAIVVGCLLHAKIYLEFKAFLKDLFVKVFGKNKLMKHVEALAGEEVSSYQLKVANCLEMLTHQLSYELVQVVRLKSLAQVGDHYMKINFGKTKPKECALTSSCYGKGHGFCYLEEQMVKSHLGDKVNQRGMLVLRVFCMPSCWVGFW